MAREVFLTCGTLGGNGTVQWPAAFVDGARGIPNLTLPVHSLVCRNVFCSMGIWPDLTSLSRSTLHPLVIEEAPLKNLELGFFSCRCGSVHEL